MSVAGDLGRDRSMAALECFQQIVPEPTWTEFLFFFAYDPVCETGITLHIGRELFDPQLWRATMFVYLPAQQLLAAKCFGRQDGAQLLRLGALSIACRQPGQLWTVSYHGAAQRNSRSGILTRPHQDQVDEPLIFELAFQGATPCWDMQQAVRKAPASLAMHVEQMCRVYGDIVVGARRFAVAGFGVRDHSCGRRDYAQVEGTFWLAAVFPSGDAAMAQAVRADGQLSLAGFVYTAEDSRLTLAIPQEIPLVPARTMPRRALPADPFNDPANLHFAPVLLAPEKAVKLTGTMLHASATTCVSPSSELLGTDLARTGALQLMESVACVRMNGQTGWGVRERLCPVEVLQADDRAA